MQTTTFKEDVFRKQIKKLLDYLYLSVNEFSKECGFSSNSLVKAYLEGDYAPTLKSLLRICDRYPVRLEWLTRDDGEMWVEDYFEKRFNQYKDEGGTTPKEKIFNLMKIFEANQTQLAARLGVTKHTINYICTGDLSSLTEANKDQFSKAITYIPREYYE
ncbi:transcriptional regulator with XRE-family HTH domain [Chryseobacterium rhizosphaerae]|uniref:hypothetical protein n=1 Tax=Chryseobacterium rhizosphaerae TaxID=395937 RepID=UPI002854BC2B|nr:hypothetical protein [Chryseobacterium rhizosphaerae]MDR6548516.1 transcriptional regulator with XRE-family HTH domain [Chryseobacterium rhizosphaerae]